MGNISKINKDHLFAIEGLMKNNIVFKWKGKAGPWHAYRWDMYEA